MIEDFIALLVSTLLSTAGLSATPDGSFIHVPSLNHTFIVTLPCADWAGILLQAFTYTFITWVYVATNGHSVRRRTYLILALIGSSAFFCSNVLRIFTEIYLLGTAYKAVYLHYLLQWQAFEEQIGMGLMFATLSILSMLSYAFFKRGGTSAPTRRPTLAETTKPS